MLNNNNNHNLILFNIRLKINVIKNSIYNDLIEI